jgi:hypothetical protein
MLQCISLDQKGKPMPAAKPIFSQGIFKFLRELSRHNKKVWMDANRERYQEQVVHRSAAAADVAAGVELDGADGRARGISRHQS